jgi:SsrA-binding protein
MTVLVHNRSATFHYALEERFEAGLALLGSEVKSLRARHGSLAEAYVHARAGELFLHGMHIAAYGPATRFGHEPRRDRKILLHRRQINKILGAIARKGMTAIPLKIYLLGRGLIKIEIALAVGKKKEDKRQSIKEKEWKRQQHRTLKQGQQEG